MSDFPTTRAEFEERFSTEDACREYLYGLKWPDGFKCLACNHREARRVDNTLYRCARCSVDASLVADTMFSRSHKPLTVGMRAAWWMANQENAATGKGLGRILGTRDHRVRWNWIHKMQRRMVNKASPKPSGNVDADEAFVLVNRRFPDGEQVTEKVLVLIAVEYRKKEIGQARVQALPDEPMFYVNSLCHMVEDGSTVRTDGLSAYKAIAKWVEAGWVDLRHKVVREEAPIGQNVAPNCRKVARALEEWLLEISQGIPSHPWEWYLNLFLNEFSFRFSNRDITDEAELCERFLKSNFQLHRFDRHFRQLGAKKTRRVLAYLKTHY